MTFTEPQLILINTAIKPNIPMAFTESKIMTHHDSVWLPIDL